MTRQFLLILCSSGHRYLILFAQAVHSVVGDLSARFGVILEPASMIPQMSFAIYSMYPLKKAPPVAHR